MTQILLGTDLDQIKRCAPVLRELRTLLTEEQIIEGVQQQIPDGYRLACVEASGHVTSVAGYRITRNLSYGKFLYVDDLVTRADQKRNGHAGQLIEWLYEHAQDQGCASLVLDSGVQRFEAHRFYLARTKWTSPPTTSPANSNRECIRLRKAYGATGYRLTKITRPPSHH
jgi:GNAT superfamily N-acetyltransferase